MRKRTWLIVGFVIACVAAIGAQAPVGASLSFNTAGLCESPTAGQLLLCGTPTGLQQSVNGAPYASFIGPVGPKGATGATGPVGPQGPAGPTGTIQAKITCTGVTITSAGVVLSGCH
jgi:hypothetical protein